MSKVSDRENRHDLILATGYRGLMFLHDNRFDLTIPIAGNLHFDIAVFTRDGFHTLTVTCSLLKRSVGAILSNQTYVYFSSSSLTVNSSISLISV
ncbi:hypothetical protein D3C73_995050 [compost metagenome]